MNDPFAVQQASVGAAREGMDAPDLQVRLAQLKAQQGQALTAEENRRLGVRMGLETEAAKQDVSRGLSGNDTVFGPRSTSVYQGLAGTNLDPTLAQARVRSAVLASNPLEQARANARANAFQMGVNLDVNKPADMQQLAQVNIANQRAQALGTTPEQEFSQMQPAAPVQAEMPASTSVAEPTFDPTKPSTGPSRVMGHVRSSFPTVSDPEAADRAELSRQTAGVVMSVGQQGALMQKIRGSRQVVPVESTDHLNGDTYVVNTIQNGRGQVLGFQGEPTLKTAGTQKVSDVEFQKDRDEWVVKGDRSKTATSIANLSTQIDKLKDPHFADIWNRALSVTPDRVAKVFGPEAASVRNAIESEALSSLKGLYGGRVTNTELTASLGRIYDPALSASENASRAGRFLQGIKDAYAAKNAATDYFNLHQTIGGFKGVPSLSELETNAKGTATNSQAAAPSQAVSKYTSKFAAKPKTQSP